MATRIFSRLFFPKTITTITTRSFSTTPLSFLRRLRPLSSAIITSRRVLILPPSFRSLSTDATTSSLNDPNPNDSTPGCDFLHWLVVMEKPEGNPTRDELIDYYIKTFSNIIGRSEDEARMMIYSVSTKYYYAFGVLVSEELANRIRELPGVRWVLPDAYLNPEEKAYGGEPFINGQAVPYDPKYHKEWAEYHESWREKRAERDYIHSLRSRNFYAKVKVRSNRGTVKMAHCRN